MRILTREEIEEAQGGSTLEHIGKGLFVGATKDPFIGGIIKSIGEIAGVDPRGLEEMERQLQGKSAAEVSEFVGEFAPSLLFGAGAYTLGKAGGRAAIQQIAKGVASREVTEAAARKGILSNQFSLVATKADDIGGGLKAIQGTPALQRAAEITGGNLSLSGTVFAQEKARGKTDVDAMQSAALSMVLGVGLEGSITTIGKGLFKRARTFRAGEIDERFESLGGAKIFQDKIQAGTNEIGKIDEELRKLLHVDEHVKALQPSLFKTTPKKLKDVPEAEELFQKKRVIYTEIRGAKKYLEEPGSIPYLSDGPYVGGWLNKTFDKLDPDGKFRSGFLSSAESQFGKFGAGGNRIFTQIMKGSDIAETKARELEVTVGLLSETARKSLGFSTKKWTKGGGMLDADNAWELNGEAGLREYAKSIGRRGGDIEALVDVYNQRNTMLFNTLIKRGRQIGGKPPIDMKRMGVVSYLPHALEDISEKDLIKRFVNNKLNPMTESEAYDMVKSLRTHLEKEVSISGVGSGAPSRIGPLDYDRIGSGSIKNKADRGVPINTNSFDATLRVLQGAERRIALDPLIGPNGSMISTLAKVIEAEGGNAARFKTVVNAISGRRYYNEAMQNAASFFGGLQVTLKLPMAVIANASQSTNTLAQGGIRPFLSGAINMSKRVDRDRFAQMMGTQHHLLKGISRAVDDDGLILGPMEKMADYVLRFTGFNRIERWNRIHAGLSSLSVINDTIAKATKGRLRGPLLDQRRRMLGDMGLNIDDIVRKTKEFGDDYLTSREFISKLDMAAIRGAQKTQFFPGKTRTPTFWSHPLGRIMFQFKTFAMGQSKFLRDSVLVEAAQGNLRPMATMLAVAPVTGEAVGDIKAFIKQKDRTTNGVMRALDNISYVGGLGIFSDALSAARWGDLEGMIIGPTASDLTTMGESLLTGEVGNILNELMRTPAFKSGEFLTGGALHTVELIDEYLDSQPNGGDETTSGRTYFDVGDLRQKQIDSKR